MKIFVSIYSPLQLFPPTNNAIIELSRICTELKVVTTRFHTEKERAFPDNVSIIYSGKMDARPNKKNILQNIIRFIKYCQRVSVCLRKGNFDVAVLYDPYSLFAYWYSGLFVSKATKLVWYHNHDIHSIGVQRFFSPGWLSVKTEIKYFHRLDIFSLPAEDRKEFFPLNRLRGRYFFIPNFPLKSFFSTFQKERSLGDTIRLVFQGRIAEGHGIEAIISILNHRIAGRTISLILKGFISDSYKKALLELAVKIGVSNQVEFYGVSSYDEVIELGTTCHIGLAVHSNNDIMNRTLGTSSNKIYEYAALGLPVLLYDNAHFRQHLQRFPWAFFTNCSKGSLIRVITEISEKYGEVSRLAYKDFYSELNFEKGFKPVLNFLQEEFPLK